MKKALTITGLLIFVAAYCFAQPEVSRFGRVSDEELDMTVYSPDSSASAVILFDNGETEVVYNEKNGQFEIKYSRHVRIKVLTKDGLDWANFSIPLYSSSGMREQVSRLRGFTFNKQNGKTDRERLNTSSVIDEERSDRLTLKKFTMPKVVEGSVIDVNYDITSDYLFNLQDWDFQYSIPCIYSVYQTIIPEYYNYRQHISGYEHVSVDRSIGQRNIIYSYRTGNRGTALAPTGGYRQQETINYRVDITTYTAENVPAMPRESFVDNRNNYITRVDFELLSYRFPGGAQRQFSTNWDNIVKELLDHSSFGGQLSGTRYLRDDVQQVVSEDQSPEEQMKAVFDFIKQKISWNQRYRLFAGDGARQAYRNGTGSSAEVNFNLISALRELGFDAMPVALSTRSNGRLLPHQITISGFNHVIALVRNDGKQYLIDATSDYPNPFILPAECLNDQGRIIDLAANNFIQLDQSGASRSVTMLASAINEHRQFSGSVTTLHSDYMAVRLHERTKTEQNREDFIETLGKRYDNAEITLEHAEIDEANSRNFNASFTFASDESAIFSGDMLYLNPMPGFEFDLNPFRQQTRKLPVNFTYQQDIQYANRITIPEGYQVEEIPENLSIALPQGDCRFLFSASLMNEEVVINARLMLNRTIFPPEEYHDLKSFFDAIIKKQEQKLILKKI